MYKYTIPRLLQLFTPAITWKVKTQDKSVYITFDDGPHPAITPWVLEQLAQVNARATFFCVGENVAKFPETFEDVLKAGHAVGNHSFNHLNGWKTSNRMYFENIARCAELVKSALFRPPYGKISLPQVAHLKKNYRIVMWDVLTRDYENGLDANKALVKLKRAIGKGSVVVFHDSLKAEKNLKILLPQLLQYLHTNGFEMKSL